MNTIPASARTLAEAATGDVERHAERFEHVGAAAPRACSERLPCLAIRTPAPAATNAARPSRMLNVVTAPPPVPHVSTRSPGRSAATRIIARRKRADDPREHLGGLATDAQPHEQCADLRPCRLALHDRIERRPYVVRRHRLTVCEQPEHGAERMRARASSELPAPRRRLQIAGASGDMHRVA